MLDHINFDMKEFISKQEMMFIATSDRKGNCDNSFRTGAQGFVKVLDDKTLVYPEYRGNGVLASLGNISENPHIGLLFIDFFQHGVGLHINGRATIFDHHELPAEMALSLTAFHQAEKPEWDKVERWVAIEVEEAYIHCSKRIPMLQKVVIDEQVMKQAAGDFFNVKASKENGHTEGEKKWKVYMKKSAGKKPLTHWLKHFIPSFMQNRN